MTRENFTCSTFNNDVTFTMTFFQTLQHVQQHHHSIM